MSAGLRIKQLTFSGQPDREISVWDSDAIVLLGPNNAGKSRALREIETFAHLGEPGAVISDLSLERYGGGEELDAWIEATTSIYPMGPGTQEHRALRSGTAFMREQALRQWTSPSPLGEIAKLFLLRVDADTRLALANDTPSTDIIGGTITEPLQRLLVDHAAERQLSETVFRAFGKQVHVNRAGGSTLHLHLGQPASRPALDSPEYLAELRDLPIVAQQGDGMRSFIGLMLVLAATPYPLVLIDEPEAFLHPPQARELGRQLGAAQAGQQRVVATHSADVLLGILDVATSLTVIHLRRDGDRNVPAVLARDQVRQIWADPSLRYSNMLDGLFHAGVVISEAEGDAMLYGAALDVEMEANQQSSPDLLFTQCGGKHKLPEAVRTLRPMGVPVAAVSDLDVLREQALLQRIVEALGGEWEPLETDWRTLSRAVAASIGPGLSVRQLRAQVDDILGDDPEATLAKDQITAIRRVTSQPDGWKRAREGGGIDALPRGEAASAARRLVNNLAALGLFVVPVGALEGWDREIVGYGSRFAGAALAEGVHESNAELRSFVAQIAAFLAEDHPPERR